MFSFYPPENPWLSDVFRGGQKGTPGRKGSGAAVRWCSSKGVLKKFAVITGKHLFAIITGKVLKTCNFIKKRLQHRCFTVKIPNFIRTAFFIRHLWWLLLSVGFWMRLSYTLVLLSINWYLQQGCKYNT